MANGAVRDGNIEHPTSNAQHPMIPSASQLDVRCLVLDVFGPNCDGHRPMPQGETRPGICSICAMAATSVNPIGHLRDIDWRQPSVIALVLANLVPVFGVLALHWEVFPLMFLFWSENVIVGVF